MSAASAPEPAPPSSCANCGSAAPARYCPECGQRVEAHIHSLWGFLAEAAESVTHADSRVWRTLLPLLLRPGYLTLEFLRGRRARYLPPFRLYLLISVFFFVVLAASGSHAPQPLVLKQDSGAQPAPGGCARLTYSGPGEQWLQARLRASCARIVADQGRELGRAVVHNLPRAMFLFLPLLAALMKLMYWRPRRYYVEHLLFLVHNHAFAFLVTGLALLAHAALPTAPGRVLSFATFAYLAWYFHTAMRRVYRNGMLLTLVKYGVLALAYLAGALLMLIATLFVSAITL